MKRHSVILASAALALALHVPVVGAQEGEGRSGRTPRVAVPRDRTQPRAEGAQPRERRPERTRGTERQPERQRLTVPDQHTSGATEQSAAAEPPSQNGAENRAVARGARPRGDNPVVGRAVPRGSVPQRPGTTLPRYRYYNYSPYYYSPHYSPWGYGAFGLGYFRYDPYAYGYYPYAGSGYYAPYGSYGSDDAYDYDTGALRLQVKPRDAQVFVDGYFTGVVDSYDGFLQRLRLASGPHRIEIRAPGYEPLSLDVRVVPGETVNYKGELQRLR